MPEFRARRVRLFSPPMELLNCSAEAFLLNAGAKSSGVGVICSDAEVPDLACEAFFSIGEAT
jgi:hypothetical protein